MAVLLEELSGNLPYLKEIGQNAMNEIYISWEDSVKAAYSRYEELHDMVLYGGFRRRRKLPSDLFLESTSMILKGTEHVFDIPRNIYGGMRENIVQLTDRSHIYTESIAEFGKELGKEIRENVGNIGNILSRKE